MKGGLNFRSKEIIGNSRTAKSSITIVGAYSALP